MINFNQSSTWRGLALIGSAIAMVTGTGHLFSAEVTESGLVLGGVIGTAIPIAIGVYDTLRDEFKQKE